MTGQMLHICKLHGVGPGGLHSVSHTSAVRLGPQVQQLTFEGLGGGRCLFGGSLSVYYSVSANVWAVPHVPPPGAIGLL